MCIFYVRLRKSLVVVVVVEESHWTVFWFFPCSQSSRPHPRQRGMFARIALLHSTVVDAATAACAPDGLFIVAEALTCRRHQNEICILTMAHWDYEVALSAKIKVCDFIKCPFIYFLKKSVIKLLRQLNCLITFLNLANLPV